jgi:hypothetical protein
LGELWEAMGELFLQTGLPKWSSEETRYIMDIIMVKNLFWWWRSFEKLWESFERYTNNLEFQLRFKAEVPGLNGNEMQLKVLTKADSLRIEWKMIPKALSSLNRKIRRFKEFWILDA